MENLTANETKALLWILATVLTAFGAIILWLFTQIYSYAKKMSEDIQEQNKLSTENRNEIEKHGIRHTFLEYRVVQLEKKIKP